MNRDIDTDGMTDHRSIRYFSRDRDVSNTSGTSEIIARIDNNPYVKIKRYCAKTLVPKKRQYTAWCNKLKKRYFGRNIGAAVLFVLISGDKYLRRDRVASSTNKLLYTKKTDCERDKYKSENSLSVCSTSSRRRRRHYGVRISRLFCTHAFIRCRDIKLVEKPRFFSHAAAGRLGAVESKSIDLCRGGRISAAIENSLIRPDIF